MADSFLSRGLGLLPRSSLKAGEGLRITKTSSITMFFMRFAIDAVFLDRDLRVVKIAADLRPWKIAGSRGAKAVLEIPAGEASRRGLTVGDRLAVG